MSTPVDNTPAGSHFTRMKDGTRVWVGPTNGIYAHMAERLRVAELRLAIIRRILTGPLSDRSLQAAVEALDYVP